MSVTYAYPVSGTTPPTTKQTGAYGKSIVNAQVVFADGDTTATVTHNFELISTDPAALFPVVVITLDPSSAGTVSATILVTRTSTDSIVLTKGTGAGTNGTYNVSILRPSSVIR
jgi:hypothetical protein